MSEEVIDLEAIGDKYEEKGYFRRLRDMFIGLRKPHDTPEYKLARTELQRQAAPLIATVSVLLLVGILIVATMLKGTKEETYEIVIPEPDPPQQEQEEEQEKETPPDPPETPPDDVIPTDIPSPSPFENVQVSVTPPTKVFSAKPAPADTVQAVNSPVSLKCMTASRTPGRIGQRTSGGAMYGDQMTEAAVLKVLWWLKANQKVDGDLGSWKGGASELANTALAVLTYLAHGEYPHSPSPYQAEFGPVVEKAINFLIASVIPGSTPKMKGCDGNEYAFLIATYALCEAYGMTKNPECKEAALTCLTRIIDGQSPTGGWDYKINPQSDRDDMSFAGWALQALKAGKMANIFPKEGDAHDKFETCIKKAIKCLQERNFKNGGFNYVAKNPNPTGLTATGCLAMQLLGYGDKPQVKAALDYMREWTPTFDAKSLDPKRGQGNAPQYYCYYATQCKFQAGLSKGATKKDEQDWIAWNKAMKEVYPKIIIDDPTPVKDRQGKDHKQGHYVNSDAHTSRPVMDTCLVALQLMVYYRYLPQGVLEANEDGAAEAVDTNKKDKDEVEVDVDI